LTYFLPFLPFFDFFDFFATRLASLLR